MGKRTVVIKTVETRDGEVLKESRREKDRDSGAIDKDDRDE